MIAVDTSALIAIVIGEAQAQNCANCLASETDFVISAATLAETLVVSGRRNKSEQIRNIVEEFQFNVILVTAEVASRVAEIHGRWGRGRHEASLNFGDCFAYDAAKSNGCPLLFVGNDFTKTDIASAL